MTDTVTVAAITGIFSFLASLISLLNHRLAKRSGKTITALQESTNGRMDQLLDERGEAAYHRGFTDGEAAARKRLESKL